MTPLYPPDRDHSDIIALADYVRRSPWPVTIEELVREDVVEDADPERVRHLAEWAARIGLVRR